MSVPEKLGKLVGDWTGISRLLRPWLSGSEAESESVSTAFVELVARGKFVTIGYTWTVDDEPQEGVLLLGSETNGDTVHATWVDSWHMSDMPMICRGSVDEAGVVTVLGSYAAPPGPDWKWRTAISPRGDAAFEIAMFNISPDGEETPAFENRYVRHA